MRVWPLRSRRGPEGHAKGHAQDTPRTRGGAPAARQRSLTPAGHFRRAKLHEVLGDTPLRSALLQEHAARDGEHQRWRAPEDARAHREHGVEGSAECWDAFCGEEAFCHGFVQVVRPHSAEETSGEARPMTSWTQ